MVRAGTVLAILLVLTVGVPTAVVADELPNDDEPTAGPGVSFNASDGPNVTVGETTEFRNENPWVSAHNITLEPWGSVTSPGPTAVNVTEFNGTWTNLSSIDASQHRLTIDPNDKEPATVGGDIRRFDYRDGIALDDGTVDFAYGGPDATTATVQLREVPTETDVAAVDAATGTVLDAARSNASGYVTFDELDQSGHDVVLQSYDSSAPTVSNLSPDGSTAESDPQSITLEADVADADFANGDTVTVKFGVDGSTVDTQTISSNQTVTTTVSETTAGTHNWSVTTSDEFNNSETAESEFLIANELKIFNESAPTELVQNVNVSIEFYFRSGESGQIVTRSTDDGTINMTGLDATRPFVVVAEADGYVSRRIFVTNLSATQEIYLLPENQTNVQNDFEIRDLTGRFPQEDTVLQIQRNLNSNWSTVHGDFFGADGSFPATLQYNVRHRLIVRNIETGARRELGTYTPQTDGPVTVEIETEGDVDVVAGAANVRIDPSTRTLLAANQTVTVSIDEGDPGVDEWTAELIARNATTGQNTTLKTVTETDQLTREIAVNLSDYPRGRLFVEVSWNASGQTGESAASFGIAQDYDTDQSLLAVLGSVSGLIPDDNVGQFQSMVAILLTIVLTIGFARTARASSEVVALAALGQLAGWSLVGWVPYSIMFAGFVSFVAFAALRRGL